MDSIFGEPELDTVDLLETAEQVGSLCVCVCVCVCVHCVCVHCVCVRSWWAVYMRSVCENAERIHSA
jgi:hypothetical protein